VRAYVGDVLVEPGAARTVVFCERLHPPSDEVTLPEPVWGELVVSGTGRTVRVHGRVTTTAGLICGACLTRFAQPLDVEVDEEFARPPARADHDLAGEQALGPDDFVSPIEPGDVVDLTEVIRQHLALALPIAPRCSPACRGLCPTCGADRNAGPCGCEADEIDPRLQALREWAGTGESSSPGDKKRRARGAERRRGEGE